MIIAVVSGKGGVGKTFLSINLSVAFAEAGYRVLLVDTNFTSPTVATHFKVTPETHTIDEAMSKGSYRPTDLIWIHPAGFHFLTPSFNLVALDDQALHRIFQIIRPLFSQYDITILDGPAGVGRDVYYTLANAEAAIIVANPNYPSLYNALKTHYFAKALGKMVPGAVLNMYTKKSSVSPKEAAEILELPLLGVIPEDPNVKKALDAGIPLLKYNPSAPAARAVYEVASNLLGKPVAPKSRALTSIWEKIKAFLFS